MLFLCFYAIMIWFYFCKSTAALRTFDGSRSNRLSFNLFLIGGSGEKGAGLTF